MTKLELELLPCFAFDGVDNGSPQSSDYCGTCFIQSIQSLWVQKQLLVLQVLLMLLVGVVSFLTLSSKNGASMLTLMHRCFKFSS